MNPFRAIILCILGLSFALIAEGKIDRRENTDKFKKYKARIEEQVSELPSLTHCDDKADQPSELLECVRQSLSGLNTNDINKIEQVMELRTHRLIKSKKKQEIVGFLMTELEKKIHGDNTNSKKRKDKKYISQVDYFTLHKNRLTKSTLIETASFCREKVVISPNCLQSGGCSVGVPSPGNDIIHITKKKSTAELEIETQRLNKAGTATATAASDFHIMCMASIKELCDVYVNDTSQEDFAEACLFKDRIAKFQKTINTTAEMEKELLKHQTAQGYAVSTTYGGNFDRSNIDQITNITSDFANNKKMQDMAVDTDQLKKDCEAGKKTDQCNQYVDVMSKEEFKGIEYELKKKNAIQEVMLDQLDDDKLKEFAKNYLNDTDLQANADDIRLKLKKEFDAKKNAIIADIKKQVHGIKSGGSATSDPSVVEKEKDEKNFEFGNAAQVDLAATKAEEESNPNALRDNIFYANLVNSYLERKNTQTQKESSNFAFGEAEFANEKNLTKDDKDKYFQQRQNAKTYFETQKKSSNSRGVASTEEGDLGGLGDIFNLILFGSK